MVIPANPQKLPGQTESLSRFEKRPDGHTLAKTGHHSGTPVRLEVPNNVVKPVIIATTGGRLRVCDTYAHVLGQPLEQVHQRAAIVA